MPVYDYRCTDCGLEVEVTHGIHETGPGTCASCGGAMRKALTTPAVHFKGSGWAKKDARTASASRAGSGSGAPSTGAKSDATGDATGTSSDATSSSSTDATSDGATTTTTKTPTTSDSAT